MTTKYTREDAEKQEIIELFDAIDSGCIELNNNFLNKYAREKVQDILKSVPEDDRAFLLSSSISEDTSFFNGSIPSNCNNDIWIDISEIEVQFEGNAEDYFEDIDDWYIDGDLAYLYVGYGLTIEVDIENLKEDIKNWYE